MDEGRPEGSPAQESCFAGSQIQQFGIVHRAPRSLVGANASGFGSNYQCLEVCESELFVRATVCCMQLTCELCGCRSNTLRCQFLHMSRQTVNQTADCLAFTMVRIARHASSRERSSLLAQWRRSACSAERQLRHQQYQLAAQQCRHQQQQIEQMQMQQQQPEIQSTEAMCVLKSQLMQAEQMAVLAWTLVGLMGPLARMHNVVVAVSRWRTKVDLVPTPDRSRAKRTASSAERERMEAVVAEKLALLALERESKAEKQRLEAVIAELRGKLGASVMENEKVTAELSVLLRTHCASDPQVQQHTKSSAVASSLHLHVHLYLLCSHQLRLFSTFRFNLQYKQFKLSALVL